jgi:Enoyl-(Acyl carrier protein) reductase
MADTWALTLGPKADAGRPAFRAEEGAGQSWRDGSSREECRSGTSSGSLGGCGSETRTLGREAGSGAAAGREQATAAMPTGRFTTPEDVAALVTLLASPKTANVTGSNYVIDGGLIKTT